MKSREEWMRDVVALQRAGRWSAADAARAAAWAASGNEPTATRPEAGALVAGAVLRHMRWGKVEAECTYRGEACFEFAGAPYPSLYAVTKAALQALGKKSDPKKINSKHFWGLEKQMQSDPRGFDQTRDEADLAEDAEIEAAEPEFSAVFAPSADETDE